MLSQTRRKALFDNRLCLNPCLEMFFGIGGLMACPACISDIFIKLKVDSLINRLDSRATHENDGNEFFNLSTIQIFNSMKGGYAPC